jgi:hypothetical protein
MDAAVRCRTGSSEIGRQGGHSQECPPFAFVVGSVLMSLARCDPDFVFGGDRIAFGRGEPTLAASAAKMGHPVCARLAKMCVRRRDGCFPQNPQNGFISTNDCVLKDLDSCGLRSNIPFTGGAILQKERVQAELSAGSGNGAQTWHTGDWVQVMEPRELLRRM